MQTRGNRFIKKTSKSTKHQNNSSEQNSSRSINNDEPEVKMEVFGMVKIHTNKNFLLITPNCLVQFPELIQRLSILLKDYSKEEGLKFIQENMRQHHKIPNISNLQAIENQTFWNDIFPKLIKFLINELPNLSCKFKLLPAKSADILNFTRKQIFLVLISMLTGIMPPQPYLQCVTFGQLMVFKQYEQFPIKCTKRREKLKCILTYFTVMINNKQIMDENIILQRLSHKNIDYFEKTKRKQSVPLKKVKICHSNEGKIEDYCGTSIMINPCSKCIGANVLKNGLNKEDILFSIFPQIYIIKLLCEQLHDSEAILVHGARRFALHKGQGEKFEYEGQFPLQDKDIAQKSMIVCIDGANYQRFKTSQYSKTSITREINKAFTGIEGASFVDRKMPVCTGKWGCGAYGGDQTLKFFILWIASSEANRQMVYVVNNQLKITEYQLMVKELAIYKTLELLEIIYNYINLRHKGYMSKATLLEYLKEDS